MKPFMYYKGLKQLAHEVNGNENIYLGIRPYGFHSGNMLPFVVYPRLLCEEVIRLGKVPSFNFYVFINDWEQDKLDGPNPIDYPFNVYPANTTFQHVYITKDKKKNIVDKWEPVIMKGVKSITSTFKKTKVYSIRNSSIKSHPLMKKYLLKTLREPGKIAEIFRKRTGRPVLDNPLEYVIAVCPKCGLVKGQTRILYGDMLEHSCEACGIVTRRWYKNFDYWFYHKPLAIPRLEIFKIDFCITGGDHFAEGDFYIRQDLIKLFGAKIKPLKVLYTPVILGFNGERMGKSKKNDVVLPIDKLMNLVKKNSNANSIKINVKP